MGFWSTITVLQTDGPVGLAGSYFENLLLLRLMMLLFQGPIYQVLESAQGTQNRISDEDLEIPPLIPAYCSSGGRLPL